MMNAVVVKAVATAELRLKTADGAQLELLIAPGCPSLPYWSPTALCCAPERTFRRTSPTGIRFSSITVRSA